MISCLRPDSNYLAGLRPTYASRHYQHLAPTQPHWGRGSRFSFAAKRPFVNGLLSMVGSKESTYNQYFAQSPGRVSTSQTDPTDKVRMPSSPSSVGSCTATDSPKSQGKRKAVSTRPSTVRAGGDSDGISTPSGRKSHSTVGVSPPERQESTSGLSRPPPSGRFAPAEAPTPATASSMDHPTPVSRDASPEPLVAPKTLLNKKRKEIVDKAMLTYFHPLFNKWLDQVFGAMRRAADEADSSGQSGGGGSHSADGQDAKKQARGQKRQYRREDDRDERDQSADENEDGDRRRRGNISKRARRITDDKPKLACPFFKNDPIKYKSHRTCCGPGWDTVHRVKYTLFPRAFAVKGCYTNLSPGSTSIGPTGSPTSNAIGAARHSATQPN